MKNREHMAEIGKKRVGLTKQRAQEIGAIGGTNGTGIRKVRGSSEYYSELSLSRKNIRKKCLRSRKKGRRIKK